MKSQAKKGSKKNFQRINAVKMGGGPHVIRAFLFVARRLPAAVHQ